MICGSCKTIIGFEEEVDSEGCAKCNKAFCPVCAKEDDFWWCEKCKAVLCNECVIPEYFVSDEGADPGESTPEDDHYLMCSRCCAEVELYY